MLIDAPPTLLNTIIHKKHLSHFMAKNMNELAHKSPLILSWANENHSTTCKETKQKVTKQLHVASSNG